MTEQTAETKVEAASVKLDLGCGKSKQPGFLGVDSRPFEGVDVVTDLGKDPWPWPTDSVDEARASHLVEHFDATERIHFVNELWRVLKPAAKAQLITPHWCSTRAYGDLTHKWPPVAEFWFFYLNKDWRATNAPHNDAYTCNFEATWAYSLNPALSVRGMEFQQFAIGNYKDSVMDIIATVTKKP